MQHVNTHPRGLGFCGSSIDARLEEPVPLRVRKSHGEDDADVVSGPSSRCTSSGSVSRVPPTAGPLTIMKRRGRHNRPSLRAYMEGPVRGSSSRRMSSASQRIVNLDSSKWLQQPVEHAAHATKHQSLIVRKVRQRQSSLGNILRDAFNQGRNQSISILGRPWRSDSPDCKPGAAPENHEELTDDRTGLNQVSLACGQTGGPSRACCVLSPNVSVTSDVSTLEGGGYIVWAAVEVAGRLSRIAVAKERSSDTATGSFVEHDLDRYFEFGCLYDLTVQILPTSGSTVLQVLKEQDFPTTIYAGSSVLLLVKVRIDRVITSPPRHEGHVRQRSDELMEDLEFQLGNLRTEYMQVRICYSHSAFPNHADGDKDHGVSSLQSTMETVAVATLKRCNGLSPWSPRPVPTSNTLFQLIAQHWGRTKADEAMQQILWQRSTPRKPGQGGGCDLDDQLEIRPTTSSIKVHHPPSPLTVGMRSERLDGESEDFIPHSGHFVSPTPAASLRAAPSSMDHERYVSVTRLGPSASDLFGLSYDWNTYCEEASEVSSSRRRPVGAESMKGLDYDKDEYDSSVTSRNGKTGLGAAIRAKRQDWSRWGWASWF